MEDEVIGLEDTECIATIPVLRPKLPAARKLLPYLERIDEARVYSNFGPLVHELQDRLQASLAGPGSKIICTSSGTAALSAAILALAGRAREKRLAVVPDLTFAATAAAVERCGYDLHLAEVNGNTWQLDPVILQRHTRLSEIGVVVPVAAYGRPVEQEPWVRFTRDTGIPVVIDAAAAFASLLRAPGRFVGEVPVALSFHATKSFGVGEGGCVVWSAPSAEQRLSEAVNFGFFEDRLSVAQSSNGKMSEYHAAVGLAEFDGWGEKATAFERVIASYRSHAAELGLADRLILFPESDYIYPMFVSKNREESDFLQGMLSRANIGSRLWYRLGLHSHPEFGRCPSDDLSTSKDLAGRLLGLPMTVDLADHDVRKVLNVIHAALRPATQHSKAHDLVR